MRVIRASREAPRRPSVGLKIPAVAGSFVGVFCIRNGAMVGLFLRPSQVGRPGGD